MGVHYSSREDHVLADKPGAATVALRFTFFFLIYPGRSYRVKFANYEMLAAGEGASLDFTHPFSS